MRFLSLLVRKYSHGNNLLCITYRHDGAQFTYFYCLEITTSYSIDFS